MRVDISVAREALERAAVFTLVRGTTLPTTVLTVHAGGIRVENEASQIFY